MVEVALHLEPAYRTVERRGGPGREILHRYLDRGRGEGFTHLFDTLSVAEEVVEQRTALRILCDDLRDDGQAELFDVKFSELLGIEQCLLDDSRVVYLAFVGFTLPFVAVHIELLGPEAVECGISGFFNAAHRHARIEFKSRFDRLAFVHLVAVHTDTHQHVVGGDSCCRTP